MEKIKFGIQLIILMLAFPVLLLTEIRQADQEMKRNQQEKKEMMEANKPVAEETFKKAGPVSGLTLMPGDKLMVVNI